MKNTIKLITVLAVAIILSSCGKKPEELFQAGLKNYHEEKYLFAIEFFEKALKIEPENIKAKFYLGMSYKKNGQIDKALETMEDCQDINPNDFYISFNIGDCYFLQDNYDKTLYWVRKSLAIKPDFIESHFLLANAMLKKGQPQQAKDEFEFILNIIEESDPFIQNESLFHLANIYREEGKLDKSLANLKEILISRPGNVKYLYNLGLTYNAMGNKQKALNIVDQLKTINSEKADELNAIVSKN